MLVCGVSILLWSECMSVLQDHITVLSIKTPHCLTLHKDSDSTLTVSIQLKEGAKPFHGRPYPIPKVHKATLMK
jgi:hypothetical protein